MPQLLSSGSYLNISFVSARRKVPASRQAQLNFELMYAIVTWVTVAEAKEAEAAAKPDKKAGLSAERITVLPSVIQLPRGRSC